jgi:hypothetical protein
MEELLASGYNLMERKHGLWSIEAIGHSSFTGSFMAVVYYMIKRMGFDIDDIEEAIEVMEDSNHNAVHFGVYRTWIYTFDAETKNGQIAS